MLGGMSRESSAEYYRLARVAVQVEAARGGPAAVHQHHLLCINTMHQVAAAVRIPMLHLVEVMAAAARGAGGRTVGLLGAAFTMEQDFCRDRLASHGLTVIVPDAADRAVVHRVGYDELVVGVVSQASRKAYLAVIDRLAAAGAQGIVPGCTRSSCSSGCTTAQCRRSRPPASTSGPPSTEPSPRADQRTSPARRACTRETGGDHAVVRASQASDTGLRGASARNDGGPGRGGAPRGGDPHPHPRTGEATRLV